MYAKCGALSKATELLVCLPSRDVVSWNALIAGHAQHGQGLDALRCFEQMQQEGFSPDAITFTCILKACGSTGATDRGQRIHDELIRQGLLGKDIVLGNALVDMYAKCCPLTKAQHVLEELPARDAVSWNVLIGAYAQQGEGEKAFKCFEWMLLEGLSPDAVTFTCILNACGSIRSIEVGEQIHREIAEQGFLGEKAELGNALVDMYGKCGALMKAQKVLEGLPARNAVSWNALIDGYVQYGKDEDALDCFERMQQEGLSPNRVTFACILKACGSMALVDKGEQIHNEIVMQGLLRDDVALWTALVDMYVRCGALMKAWRVLEELPSRDAIAWNALITGFSQQGRGEAALDCYEKMQHEGVTPDEVTFACILKACGSLGAVDKGKEIHDEITRRGLLVDNVVLGNALVDMYAKCGALSKAAELLNQLPARDVGSWNALIAGYVQELQSQDALDCFELMQCTGVSPNVLTFASILRACASRGATDKGEQIHDDMARRGVLGKDILLSTSLVDMYTKCGALTKARRVLEDIPAWSVSSWNMLIAGFAQQGRSEDALTCFELMQSKGLFPDMVTFSCVLNACSHSGLVDEGQMYFANMVKEYYCNPDSQHYTCIIDLLGRAGHVDKAVLLIEKMPSDYAVVWSALLSACRTLGYVNTGRWAFQHALEADASDPAAYVLMANLFGSLGMSEDAEKIEALRIQNKAWKSSFWIDSIL